MAENKKKLFFNTIAMSVFLGVTNLLIVIVMIFENQMDLINSNFKFHSENLTSNVFNEVKDIVISPEKDENFERLKTTLLTSAVESFIIADKDGKIIHENQLEGQLLKLPENFSRKTSEIINMASFLKSRFDVELDTENFTVNFIIPLKTPEQTDLFLYTNVSIQIIQDRIRLLYQYAIFALLAGTVIFGLLILIFYRKIFVRLNKLQAASDIMATGKLDARAEWNFKQQDELDSLGESFNHMAEQIEKNVNQIKNYTDQLDTELLMGKMVQENFLPVSNKIFKQHNIAIWYRPMREVSGDIYYFYELGKSKSKVLFMADATGHGVSAALVTVVMMSALREYVKDSIIPGKLIKKLNDNMFHVLQSAFYATGVFFLFDNQNTIYFTNAGHNPPLYITAADKKINRMFAKDTILGLDEESEFSTNRIAGKPGDRLLLYTDGLVESANTEGKMFGLEKVESLLREHESKSTKEIVKILRAELEEFTAEFTDDVTIIMLEIPENEA